MKAMVLAAGVGHRMRPLTYTLPKPTLAVLGRPIVVQILERLRRSGVEEAVVNLHHLPGVMQQVLETHAPDLPGLHFSSEEQILGTGGGIRKAADRLRGGGPIVVTNSDALSDIDFRAAVETHRESGAEATLVLAPSRPAYSVVEVDSGGRVLSLAGAPEVPPDEVSGRYLFTGVQVIEESVLDRIPAGRPSDIVRDVHRRLAAEGRLHAHFHHGFWWEFGSPALYLDGTFELLALPLDRRLRVASHDAVRPFQGAMVSVGAGAEIHARAAFRGRAAVGLACRVGRDSVVEDSVVMPEAWVGPECRLRRTIVAQGIELPAGFEADHAVICADPGPDVELPRSTHRLRGLLVHEFGNHANR